MFRSAVWFLSIAAVHAYEQQQDDSPLLRGTYGLSSIPELVGAKQLVDIEAEQRPRPATTTSTKPAARSCTYTGIGTGDCPSGQFCAIDNGICLSKIAFAVGECKTIPDICNMMYDPQCGCDFQTYSNSCVANGVGMNIASSGECPTSAPTPAGTIIASNSVSIPL